MSASIDTSVDAGVALHSNFWFNPKHFRFLRRQMISVMSKSDEVGTWPPVGNITSYWTWVITPRVFKRVIVVFSWLKHARNVMHLNVRIWSSIFLITRRPPSITSICNRNKNIRLSGVCGWPPVAILLLLAVNDET
jgi:hypothetical protein